jgi:hypothetical protein
MHYACVFAEKQKERRNTRKRRPALHMSVSTCNYYRLSIKKHRRDCEHKRQPGAILELDIIGVLATKETEWSIPTQQDLTVRLIVFGQAHRQTHTVLVRHSVLNCEGNIVTVSLFWSSCQDPSLSREGNRGSSYDSYNS